MLDHPQETRAHFQDNGVDLSNGVVSIGQSVAKSDATDTEQLLMLM